MVCSAGGGEGWIIMGLMRPRAPNRTKTLPTLGGLLYAERTVRHGSDRETHGALMLQHFNEYGYLGVFVALIAAGFGFPIPEELPVITAGILVGHEDTTLKWYIMLPVVMAGVVIGDGILYAIGRLYGRRLLNLGWVQRHFVPPEKRAEIERNFATRGIMVLLGARLLPGIRTPIFIMAGILRVPFGRFLFADAIYAVPMVNVIFWLSYTLTDQVLVIFNRINEYKPLVLSHLLAATAGALLYKYVIARHVSTGEPPHMPKIITKPAGAIGHAMESAVEKVTGRHHPLDKEAGEAGLTKGVVLPESGDGKPEREQTEGTQQAATVDGKPTPSTE
jgi:membrane protein DedA with SNARE-associated domain